MPSQVVTLAPSDRCSALSSGTYPAGARGVLVTTVAASGAALRAPGAGDAIVARDTIGVWCVSPESHAVTSRGASRMETTRTFNQQMNARARE